MSWHGMHFLYYVWSGVLQGCPLSGSLFVICLNPFLNLSSTCLALPYEISRAFADDLAFVLHSLWKQKKLRRKKNLCRQKKSSGEKKSSGDKKRELLAGTSAGGCGGGRKMFLFVLPTTLLRRQSRFRFVLKFDRLAASRPPLPPLQTLISFIFVNFRY